jgi:hypothetical protein
VLCCAVRCGAVLCCAVLCCAVLCYAVQFCHSLLDRSPEVRDAVVQASVVDITPMPSGVLKLTLSDDRVLYSSRVVTAVGSLNQPNTPAWVAHAVDMAGPLLAGRRCVQVTNYYCTVFRRLHCSCLSVVGASHEFDLRSLTCSHEV